jgi:TIR domain
MASVFLSYDRDDTERARHFAHALEKGGHKVWWDLHVRGGAQFSKVIEEALKAADAVVVLWSANSIESAWVRDEAAAARDTGRLVPVTIDATEPPLGFRQFQTIDLSRWKGRGNPAQLRALLADVESTSAGAPPVQTERVREDARTRAFTALKPILLVLALLGMIAAGTSYWLLASNGGRTPTVAVSAADASPQSERAARDLLVKLGNLQSVRTGSMTLINRVAKSSAPDLLFQTADTSTAGRPSATLTLLEGSDQGVLWSRDFEQASGSVSDLKQQLAFTAGNVLGCALDGLPKKGPRLARETLKTYLNACAQLSDIAATDPRPIIPMLQQVTRDAPTFAPAWRKLLLAQATISDLNFTNGTPDEPARTELRRLIDEARARNLKIAEADLAETELLPPTAYGERFALIDRAVRQSPDDPEVLSFRATHLAGVGRMTDAVEDSARASQIDSLSPSLRGKYIVALALTGHFDATREQLAELEKLWPGTQTTQQVRFFFYFRYGDPKVALGMPEAQDAPAGVRYLLEARIDPSPANVGRLLKFMRARKEKLGEDAGPDRVVFSTVALAAFHQHDELFDTLMHWPKPIDLALASEVFFRPELHEFRKEPRFLLVIKRAKLLDYWRRSGHWPDFCFDADMTYDCKKEAAKIAS